MRVRGVVLVAVALLAGCGRSEGNEGAARPDPTSSTSTAVLEPAPSTSTPVAGAPATPAVSTSPAPTTTSAPPPAPAHGRVDGTVVVPEGAERSSLFLIRDDTQVASFEANTTSPFAFESIPPGTYRLDHEVSSPVETAPDGSQTSSASYTRGDPFDVTAGATVTFTCDRGCTRA